MLGEHAGHVLEHGLLVVGPGALVGREHLDPLMIHESSKL
jgi:hypothetical protein